MSMRDLVSWTRGATQPMQMYREERSNPFVALHREMNRLFDGALRTHEMPTFLGTRPFFVTGQWPKLEATETEICVMAERPGLGESEVEASSAEGTPIIRGERKSELEDKDRLFNERYHGHFERRIPVGMDVEEDKGEAMFENGVLEITPPKSERARAKARRITINAPTRH